MSDFITPFGPGLDMPASDPDRHGVKGANLITMAGLGLPVPPGFVIATDLGRAVAEGDVGLPDEERAAVNIAIEQMETSLDQAFGRDGKPLLLSVRSGAAISMPGMMDTVLNLGFNDDVVERVAEITGDERFAWDTYRRFIASFAQVVLGCDVYDFEDMLDELRASGGVDADSDMPTEMLREAVARSFAIVDAAGGEAFPQDVHRQMELALLAVFRSWNTDRAKKYREIYDLADDVGTAAIVQAMVFGNRDARSCTGVMFTRNPSTGEALPYGEWLPCAQGEDVVAGFRNPRELTEVGRERSLSEHASLEAEHPDLYAKLITIGERLERHFADMQEIEFTVETGRLFLLQTRRGKRLDRAELAISVALAEAGTITRAQAVERCGEGVVDTVHVASVDAARADEPLAKGLPACAGAVSGAIALTSDDAVTMAEQGDPVILVRPETSPEDVHGMFAAVGILTSRGGMTSHAAVNARSMNRPCITAATAVEPDAAARTCTIAGRSFAAGDRLTVDGASGHVYAGEQPLVTPKAEGPLATLLEWKAAL